MIVDFNHGQGDKIDLTGVAVAAGIYSLADVLSHAQQVGPNTVVAFSATDSLTLQNVTASNLVAGDFIFAAGGNTVTGDADANTLVGTGGPDTLIGLAGNDRLQGMAGYDLLDGGAGFDRAVYSEATGSITVDLAAGTATGAGVGTDTFVDVEGAVGSDYADTFNTVGFAGSSGIPASFIGLSEFEGRGGNDIIIGAVNVSGQILTRISYASAAAAVNVDIAAGTASGDASIGNDTFTNVHAVIGSEYGDTLSGSDNGPGTFEQFDGRTGNDLINGRGGYDFAVYNLDPTTTGISVNLAAGTVVGDAVIGTDTLLAVEGVRGTNFNDTYDATGFGASSANAGSLGTFNNFDGQGGDDTIIGNGNTRLQYSNSLDGVTVNIALGTAHGTAGGDVAQVGTDTFTGVSAVMGSTFDDTLLGSVNGESFVGLAGNDFIDGRNGFDSAQYNNLTYTTGGISVDMTAGIVIGDASIGVDTLRSIEGVQGTFFNDAYVATGYGAGGLNIGNNGTFNQFEGMAGNDSITGNGSTRILYSNASGAVTVDIAAGTATGDVSVGTDTFTGVNSVTGSAFADQIFGSANGENFAGLAGNDFINGRGDFDTAIYVANNVTAGISVDLAAGIVTGDASVGTDTLQAIEGIQGTNFADTFVATGFGTTSANAGDNGMFNQFQGMAGNDIVTGNGNTQLVFNNATAGVNVNLGTGIATGDTSVGTDTITGGISGVQGSGFNDILTGGIADEFLSGNVGNDTLNGAGGNDSLSGGAGADTFVYATGGGSDSISDFNRAAGDRIDLTGQAGVYNLAQVQALVTDPGGSTVITFSPGNSLTLWGVDPGTLTAADFIFAANSAPTDILLSGTSIAENSAAGAVVGTLSDVDPDVGDAATYTLMDSAGGRFALSNGQIVVAGVLNYETTTSHQITVRVTDAANNTFDKNFTIGVTNVNEAPTNITLSNSTIAAGSANNTVVGSLAALDPDAGDSATFTLADNDGGLFAISGGNLVVADSLSNVSSATRQVTVHVTDSGGLSFDKQLTLTVTGLTAGATFTGTGDADNLTGTAGNDIMQGLAGNDVLNGGGGQDIAIYTDETGGLTVNLAAGTVAGASVGTDTLLSIEGVQGSNFVDNFTSVAFNAGSANAGSPSLQGPVNATFEGMGGSDSITGNGRTTASYFHATAAVTVTLSSGATNGSATSTAGGDAASIGTDTLINVNWVRGSEYGDTLNGGAGNDVFIGGAGNDAINGGTGFDLATYAPGFNDTITGGISVTMSTEVVIGDGSVGTDTLRSIESVRGTKFADTYVATNFGATGFLNPSVNNVGNNQTFNEFEGVGGNDTITGNGNTRILYWNASDSVTVDIAAGTADGDVSVGHDTFSGVVQVRGSSFNDTLLGSNNPGSLTEVFDGWTGNDFIDGRGGFDQAVYNSNGAMTTSGITVNMAAGTVVGDASIGTDTLRSIEQVYGSNFSDSYDATNFGLVGYMDTATNNVGNSGTFNSFQGNGGNDTIAGNGNTQIVFFNATGSVTVNLANGTVSGDTSVGSDTIIGGVNNVQGSNSNDSITGSNGNDILGGQGGGDTIDGGGGSDTITGGAGNDAINGGAGGDIAVFSGGVGNYGIDIGLGTVTDNRSGSPDGTDTLTGVELLQFADAYRLIASSTAGNSIDLSGVFLSGMAAVTTMTAASNDYLTIGQGFGGRQIDLGAGNDTLTLGTVGFYTLNLANVENVVGSAGDDFINITTPAGGLSIDGAAGNDNVALLNGVNSVSISNVESIGYSDFGVGVSFDDTLTLLNGVSGVSINLANGGNTLNLTAAVNSLNDVFNANLINGSATDDALTINGYVGGFASSTIDLGAGDDTLNLAQNYGISLIGVEYLNGNGSDNSITINNNVSGLSVDLGDGQDTLWLANGLNSLSVAGVENINGSDFGGLNPSHDTLTLLNTVSGVTVNLGDGANTLNLAAGNNSFANLFGVNSINGSASADALALQSNASGTIDLGGGTDALNLNGGSFNLTVVGAETINGSVAYDNVTISNASGATTVTAGVGGDAITAGAGQDNFRFTSATDSPASAGLQTDVIANFDASSDTFTFSGMSVAGDSIEFHTDLSFSGEGQASARLANQSPGHDVLQIDLNGDGTIGAGDMEVTLMNLTGTLQNSSFLLSS